MEKIRYRRSLMICLILLMVYLTSNLQLGSTPFLLEVTADLREFEVERFDENIKILPNAHQAIDLDLQEGEEFEIVFSLQVKEALPVDVWFVNEDHYTLLSNGAQFLFFIDGSAQEITYTKKIVTLEELDNYKIVVTNYYNNQTVEVNIIYETRTYYAESDETPSNDISMFVIPLSILVIILVFLLLVLLMKVGGYKQKLERVSRKALPKKKKLRKSKKPKSKEKQKASSKKSEGQKSNEAEPEITNKASPGFCGYCGTRITTPFCTNCGRKI